MGGLLLGGMGLPATGSQAAASGLTIRELILENIIATLEAVKAMQTPVAAAGNASQGVAASASGAYTGVCLRLYRGQVVLAGASGVAKMTFTDVTASLPSGESQDNGPTATVVTSGSAIVVGTKGVSVTFEFAGTLVLGDTWDVWVGVYQTNVVHISRKGDLRPQQPVGVYGQLLEPIEVMNDFPVGYTTKTMTIVIAMQLNRLADPPKSLERVLGDIEKAILADYTRGGYAIDTVPENNLAYALDEVRAYSGFDFTFSVQYRHVRGDPRTQ
jgi:hypothetical protein